MHDKRVAHAAQSQHGVSSVATSPAATRLHHPATTGHPSTKFFVYARKSTDDGSHQIRSIDDQLSELREMAAAHGYEVIAEFIERQSAKTAGRPVLNEMLERIERGEASGILAWHPDRLARNWTDGGRIFDLVDLGFIRELKFSTYWFESNPQGKLMLAIAFGMSKYYVDKLSEDIRRAQRRMISEGRWPARTPMGYVNDPVGKTMHLDPIQAPIIRKLFELFGNGTYTLESIKESGDALGLRHKWGRRRKQQLSLSSYHRMLTNPIYYGLLQFGKEINQGKHDPLITKELFDRVGRLLAKRAKTRGHGRPLKPYLYRAMFRCGECGCTLTIETQKGHNYLRCTRRRGTCSQPYLREEEVSRQVNLTLDRFLLPRNCIDAMRQALEDERKRQAALHHEQVTSLTEALAGIQRRLDQLLLAHLEAVVSADEYRQAKTKLLHEKLNLEGQLGEIRDDPARALEPIEEFLSSLNEAAFLACEENQAKKRDFVKKVCSNLTFRDKRIGYTPIGPWKIVADAAFFADLEQAAPLKGAAPSSERERSSLSVTLWERCSNFFKDNSSELIIAA